MGSSAVANYPTGPEDIHRLSTKPIVRAQAQQLNKGTRTLGIGDQGPAITQQHNQERMMKAKDVVVGMVIRGREVTKVTPIKDGFVIIQYYGGARLCVPGDSQVQTGIIGR